jgi:alginate O-acetyltransferase complex protein AlgJ
MSLLPDLTRDARSQFHASWDSDCLLIQGWVVGHHHRAYEVDIRTSDRLVARIPVGVRRPDAVAGEEDDACGFKVLLETEGSGTDRLDLCALLEGGMRVPLGGIEVERFPDPAPGHAPPEEAPIAWSVGTVDGGICEQVLVGRAGWLFLRQDSNDVVGQHTGSVKLDKQSQQAWARVLADRMATVERLGATWIFLVVPDKESVYPEHLPRRVTPSPRRPIHDFLDAAQSLRAPVTYLLDDLRAAKATGELYPRTDTHWNDRGAYVGYRRFCGELAARGIAVPVVDEARLRWSEIQAPGDLGGKWYPAPIHGSVVRTESIERRGRLRFDNAVHNHGRVMIFEQDEPGGPSCVVFGESFTEQLLVFLKETFRRLVFVHTSMLIAEVLEHEAPDVVLSLPVERFLLRVPDDRDALNQLDGTARGKGGALPGAWVA